MLNQFKEKALAYGRMIKFTHSIFALPFALSAVVLASQRYPITLWTLFWIIVAMVCARSSAMGFNRVVDAAIDKKNPRTAMREIPTGTVTKESALLFILLSAIGFILSAAMLSKLCFYLSFPVLGVLYFYSFTKRFTRYCHLYLGFAISLAPIGAWIAISGQFSLSIVLLSIALLTYISGFDILYACQDADFDQAQGLKSMPARLGIKQSMKISSILHGITFFSFIILGMVFGLGVFYWISVALIGGLLIIEHLLVKPNDLEHINIAFFHINSVIAVVQFAGIALSVGLS